MSAFAGLLMLDGSPCPPHVVQAMLSRLRHRVEARGWAAKTVRCEGAVGLGFAPLLCTPQSHHELKRPDEAQTWSQNGHKLWITSDARLDNRAQLAEELKLGASEAQTWSDGRLILEAYARWGDETPAHLRGDFAFAIWDAARNRLFCARDRFGTKPFYYAHLPGQFFAFASEIKALWPVPGLEKSLNETQIGEYLLGHFHDKNSTFYRDARRLSPASWMEITPRSSGELRENLFWQLDGMRELNLPRDEDYADLLRDGFTHSVRERMRCDDRFAVFLSGGLDSSSVAAIAAREADAAQRPIPALSTVFERFSGCDERQWINQTLARGEFAPISVWGDDLSPLGDIERLIFHLDQPPMGINTASAWAQYAHLQKAGVRAVLDGHGGDEVIFLGYQRVDELLRQGRFRVAYREMKLLRGHGIGDETPMQGMWSGMLWHARGWRGIGRLFTLARNAGGRAKSGSGDDLGGSAFGLLAPDFAARFDAAPDERPMATVRQEHHRTLDGALGPLALEVLDAMAGAHAIESRTPFLEQNVAEMCLAFPSEQKMRDGFNRHVMRRAMEGVLAPEVQWRAAKTEFSTQVVDGLRVAERAHIDQLLDLWEVAAPGVSDYVDLEQVRGHWLALQNAPFGSYQAASASFMVWKVLSLGLWIDAQKSGGAMPKNGVETPPK